MGMKSVLVGALVVTMSLAAGCAKSAAVRPDERVAANPTPAPDASKPVDTAKAPESKPVEETTAQKAPEKVGPAEKAGLREAVIYFGYDADSLTPAAREQLAAWAEQVKKAGVVGSLVIEGHADERGTEEYNLALGDRRANAVRRYLVQLGVNGKQVKTVSYGESRPAAEGTGESVWAKNRRANIVPSSLSASMQ